MNLDCFCAAWPHSYHVTSEANLPSIRASRILWPARNLLERANRPHLVQRRRTDDLLLRIETLDVIIRNQIPLDPALLDLGSGFSLAEYIECLNSYVFFWPGTSAGPGEDGVRMFQRTNANGATVIRVPTPSLFEANAASPKYVATCNTGVTWTKHGIKARRGPEVFQRLEKFSEQPIHVREICFKGEIHLPAGTMLGATPTGPWKELCEADVQ